ncbi:MAG TPA: SDR family NAD(P)-dependent oxidoreductase, partial [Gemmatimonadales bacterium]|nr:SDR family NAD(P)-dependent oxidoreductase [Gemmatimonadales bacterium]
MTAPLTGTVAVVTGASRGIGLAVADELRAAGAHVVRLARSLSDGESERQTDYRADVAVAADVDRVVARVLETTGVPDIVVNNAGIFFIKGIAETSPADFARTLAT